MSLLDFGFKEPKHDMRHPHRPYTFDPPAITLEPYSLFRPLKVDFERCSSTRAGFGYEVMWNKCPCGANDWHCGGGPYDHAKMRLLHEYAPGAVRYDGIITLDMLKMAKNVIYQFNAKWMRGKLAGVNLRVYEFRNDADFGVLEHLKRVIRPGDTA